VNRHYFDRLIGTAPAEENIFLQHPFCVPAWSMGRPESQFKPRETRRDGWTAERQLRFLAALTRTRSVTRAAASVSLSRESAYRLRARDPHSLFAAAWDRAMEGHNLVNFVPMRSDVLIGGIAPNSGSHDPWLNCAARSTS
jgi:hypothetical protein